MYFITKIQTTASENLYNELEIISEIWNVMTATCWAGGDGDCKVGDMISGHFWPHHVAAT